MIMKVGDMIQTTTEEEAVHLLVAFTKEGINVSVTPIKVTNEIGEDVTEYRVVINR